MRIQFNFLILWLLLTQFGYSQFNNLKFENLDTYNGLSSSTCVEIYQDDDGFLWIGTIDGLNKYNGYEFEVFRSVLNDETSISNNRINTIVEDNQGNLWVGTNNGLNLFNKQTRKFTRINLYDNLSLASTNKKIINDLLYDGINNNLWVATNIGVIKIELGDYIIDSENSNFSYYIHNQSDVKSIDNNSVNVILKDPEGNIWIATNGEYLNKYNSQNNNFDRIYIDSSESYELNHITKKMFIDADGDFWIGNDASNFILWNRKSNTFKHVSISDKSIPVYDIYQDRNGLFWMSTDVHGLFLFEKHNNEIKVIQNVLNDYSDPFSLPNNKPTKIIEDKSGVFWIGSYDKGVSMLDLSNSFGHYYFKPYHKNGLNQKTVQSVLQDSKGRIWISAYSGGLNLFNENTQSFTHFESGNNSSSLSSNKIMYTFEGNDGSIWVCTLDGGVNKFNPETGQSKVFVHRDNDVNSIGQSSVWTGVEDKEGRVWFGLRTEGLSVYNAKTNKFTNYKNEFGNDNNLISNAVLCSFIDSKNRLFIGTSLGLNVINLNAFKSYIPERLNFDLVKGNGLEGIGINYITEDHLGNIWVGADSGVHKLSTKLNITKSYSSTTGLPNNLVVGIQEDNDYNIWITTKGGLSLLNPNTHVFKNFNAHDGLQGPEFQSKSITKTNDGRIIVGGINGFNMFHPKDIVYPASVNIKPQITNFRLNNKNVVAGDSINGRIVLNKGISEVQNITLKYNENYISFEFLGLYLENPDRVQYAYRMNGLDDEFIKIGSNRVVNLSNLESGDYTFEVKATTTGQWDEAQATTINLKILPPIWRTWWAYVIYLVLGVLISWVILHYYTLKVQEGQLRELDQMKLQFFVNVSHEFRTPLTLILNPVDKILSSFNNDPEVVKTSALSIQRSARRLLHLVNQLLDYRKMDVGMSPVRLEKGDIIKFGQDIFSLFKGLAFKKEIEYKFKSASNEIIMLFDFDKVEKIITNLISNALKFTGSGGKITVAINRVEGNVLNPKNMLFKKGKLNDYVEIVVKDTGVGLDKDQLKHIFSRFHNEDPTKTGTGIGLNFTKALVEAQGGEIHVESKLNKGAKFIVKLPINSNAKAEKVENVKNEFLINSIKTVEYDMLISDDVNLEADIENNTETNKKDKKPVVLIVEDNKELRTHLSNDLKKFYTVKQAVNGEEGLKKVKKMLPDVVISDVMMPKMNGFELCKYIKSEFETSHIPVLLLTAKTLEEDRIHGYQHGADGYISKPFVTNVLMARVKNLLDSKNRLRKRYSEIGGIFPSSEVTTNNLDEVFLDKVTKVILDNVSDLDFKQEQLLKEIGIGRSQFYRKINSLTGSNPSNFIRTIRLRYASELLLKEQYSIKEVTHMSGFNSTAYFSKTFKELFDLTPSQFIEKKLEKTEKQHI
ncbi:hybrid sensor histidine kinase/response regulator transcription factor [Neotamlana laminarinivorans]|uniref:histidine kinase n=1 Tax=Neotamlana laminarinivorans TaxID=2883124 RepID=A0A9X1L1L7_9FLAO|nr:hybrid sensor histidine kinase/response regulator transcription factor [Tamlana laminarinivorans]MCB4798825.1 response regulator [Tamlana laminarinivorans]